jgi:hypothetical protein
MDEQELLNRIEALESRIDALEKCDDGDCKGDDTCTDCGEYPCICDDIPTEDDAGVIDDDDVEEVEELDFSMPNFGEIKDDESDEDDSTNGLYTAEDEEDSPYYY